jgi:hypothetical protein
VPTTPSPASPTPRSASTSSTGGGSGPATATGIVSDDSTARASGSQPSTPGGLQR